MTCALCGYEFCWACGESASHADNHFGGLRGCGVRMMDDTVKAGRYATNIDGDDDEAKSKCSCLSRCRCRCNCFGRNCCKKFWIIVACIIFSPLILVLALPCGFALSCKKECYPNLSGMIAGCIFGFLLGLILDPVFVSFLTIWGLLFFLFKLWV